MDAKELKKLARSLKMPGDVEVGENKLSWKKRGSLTGGKTIARVIEAARGEGFERAQAKGVSCPDGSVVGDAVIYTKGEIQIFASEVYGATKDRNSFTIIVVVTLSEVKTQAN